MKKLLSLITIMAMLLILAACAKGARTKDTEGLAAEQPTESNATALASAEQQDETHGSEKVKIGIIQPVEHPSLNQIREYIIIGLEEQGLKDKVEITYKDAQGDPSNINTIVSQFVGDEMDIIVPIGTGASQSAAAATKEIPIIFAAVSYPLDAGLVKDVNKPEANVTGVSDAIDVEQIFNLAFELTPQVETFGFIYNTGEPNSASAINKAKEYCDDKGIKYVEATITNSSELPQTAQSLVEKVDAIFTPTDNTVASAMPILSAEAQKAGIPVYTGADSMVMDGGFATVGIDYTVLGRQVAKMVKKVIDGEEISNIPTETLSEFATIINLTTADKIGIKLSEEQLKKFQIVE
ncbi:MAG: ABC transporter substrate-binding protein [Tissierellia bacterium]|jgi:putative ABC transport system substrate-binding protein|nr:ABC transporter substrate-binding protein [Tissierellia bacterium]